MRIYRQPLPMNGLPRIRRRSPPLLMFSWCVVLSIIVVVRTRYFPSGSGTRELGQAERPSSQVGTLLRKQPPKEFQYKCNCNKSHGGQALLNPSGQHWSHATNSIHKLNCALSNRRVTAIEADILLGHTLFDTQDGPQIPVMSHPPVRTSDLSLSDFLKTVTNITDSKSEQTPTLLKDVKLDFKEMQGLEPAFQLLGDLGYINPNGKMIVFHADLFSGPGRRFQPPHLDADEFMENAMRLVNELMEKNYQNKTKSERLPIAFSIGHEVDSRAFNGYTIDDMVKVLDLIDRYTNTSSIGNNADPIVFIYCPNAHLLVKDFEPIDFLMDQLPEHSQLLIWTGHGEVRISQGKTELTKAHFVREGTISRVAFDTQVANSLASGFLNDKFNLIFGMFVGAFRTIQNVLR